MMKLKTRLVEILTPNGISILAGMITGTIINLFTSDDGISRYYVAVGLFFGAMVTLMVLLQLRETIEKKLASDNESRDIKSVEERTETNDPTLYMTPRERVSWTINTYAPSWGFAFLGWSFLTLLLISAGVAETILSRKTEPKIEDQLKTIEQQLDNCVSNGGDKS